MIHAIERAPLVITLSVLALALSACTSNPGASAPTSKSAPATTQPPADSELMLPDADAPHLCGQVSALEGIRYRSDWEHDQGLIDDVEYSSRVAAIEDGWRYMVVGGTDVSPAIKDAQQALASGGIGYENTQFQRAVGDVAGACDEAGSLVSVSALPGQGG
ncbi:hypothetical protein DCE93_06115 [Agromyces badenianii]|uniref:Lipoprotein n=1 Tax=Agromyces badenianii TaxID=2080742 RepID=A0A2S0WVB8_9MICO|nr:hypothetical protein [Agromyces badenianii]AWB95286.1 hypothetical protein DCE93_06115 [Agromyces badenianii]